MPRPRSGMQMFVAALASFALVAPLTRLTGQPDTLNVLAVVVAITASRRVGTGSELAALAGLPVVAVLTALLGWLLIHDRYLAEALIVVAMFVSVTSRIAPPQVARAARLLTLPMLVLFVAPAPVHRGLSTDLPWYVLVSAIAGVCVLLAGRIAGAQPTAPPPPISRRPGVVLRIAAQSSLGLALAFATSQWLFPDRWGWAIVTAFAVSGGARSRGHVLLRSGERLLGAVTGTILATLLAVTLAGHTVASVIAIFALLACGAVLGEIHYVFWAFCVTSMLALLYGLFGQAGTDLLHERLEENLLGAACMIAPAFLLLPIRTEQVVRRQIALSRAALRDVGTGDPAALAHLDARAAALSAAARPLRPLARLPRSASARRTLAQVDRVLVAARRALADAA